MRLSTDQRCNWWKASIFPNSINISFHLQRRREFLSKIVSLEFSKRWGGGPSFLTFTDFSLYEPEFFTLTNSFWSLAILIAYLEDFVDDEPVSVLWSLGNRFETIFVPMLLQLHAAGCAWILESNLYIQKRYLYLRPHLPLRNKTILMRSIVCVSMVNST